MNREMSEMSEIQDRWVLQVMTDLSVHVERKVMPVTRVKMVREEYPENAESKVYEEKLELEVFPESVAYPVIRVNVESKGFKVSVGCRDLMDLPDPRVIVEMSDVLEMWVPVVPRDLLDQVVLVVNPDFVESEVPPEMLEEMVLREEMVQEV